MNVWEFLGRPHDHRAPDNTVMKVKHIDDVPESKVEWPMVGQVKKDGVYSMIVKVGGKCAIFSRTGKQFQNVQGLALDLKTTSPLIHGVCLAELCNDRCSLEELSGMVNPNRKEPLSEDQLSLMENTYMAFHDYLTIDEFIKGESQFPYPVRLSHLRFLKDTSLSCILDTYTLHSEAEADEFFKEVVYRGEEGIVLKPDELWVAGHKGYRMMKRVRGVDYDLLCIGAEEGKGKYKGLVANLIFRWKDGKTIKCMLGKGWTHLDAEDMWTRHLLSNLGEGPVGEIFQVYALQESSKGKLRLPKVGEMRHDKTDADI